MDATLEAQTGIDDWPVPSLRRVALASIATVLLGFGGLGMWAASVPLDSAVPASGFFVSASKRKTVSLLDGGILKELLVKEGQRVQVGQKLLMLDDVQVRTAMNQARLQYWGSVAKIARLEAETRDQRTMMVPRDLAHVAASDPAIAALLSAEQKLFASRWDTFDGNARISGRKIQELVAQRIALEAQLATLNTRFALTQDEAKGVEYLLTKGLETRPRALELRRSLAEYSGLIAGAEGQLADRKQTIAQTEAEFTNFAETRRSDAAKDLQEAQAAKADAAQRLQAAQNLLARSEVTSPESGIVTAIKFITPGSSIPAGQPVMDIVPGDGRLLIEAPVAPTEIERVHVGQRVNIKLSAYKAHRVPSVEGKLVYVAADQQPDEKGNAVFLVRAEMDMNALKPFPGVTVYPGMPADILVIGRERTALDFLLSPIVDGMRRGMRED